MLADGRFRELWLQRDQVEANLRDREVLRVDESGFATRCKHGMMLSRPDRI